MYKNKNRKKAIIIYSSTYDSQDIRNSTYSVMGYIKQYFNEGMICLDIGCGSCRKIIPALDVVKKYYAIDNNSQRIEDAKKLCGAFSNLILTVCDNYFLPYDKENFDIVTSFMTKYNVPEVWRVLKPNGLFIIEIPSANDKKQLKEKFGKDKLGWRGRMVNDTYSEHAGRIKAEISPFFEIHRKETIHFSTSLKTEKLKELLIMTGEIRNFGTGQDIMTLERMQSSDGLISFEEDRILIIAQKKLNIECNFK